MIHKKMQYTYVGIDSHKATHTAVFLDCFFEKLGEITFQNLPSKFPTFLEKAETCKMEGTTLLFGLEDVSSYGRTLTVFLRKQNCLVKHTNALLVARERKNQNAIQKTDAIDAECAGRVLLSKFDTLPNAEPKDKYWMLRMLVARRQFLIRKNTACKNQLHMLITSHYPNYRLFFDNIDCQSSLAFLERYPSPKHLKDVTLKELTDFFYEPSGGTVGKKQARTILEIVENNGHMVADFQEIQDDMIQSNIRQIRFHLGEIERLEQLLKKYLIEFDCPLTSMTGVDTVTAATMLSLIGDVRRFSNSAKLARYSGIAPITYASGKTDMKFSNERGNRELNSLFYGLAVRVSMTVGSTNKVINPFFYDYYHKKLSEGKTKSQALKCIQRRLVNIIWTMLTNNEEYVNPPMYSVPKKKKEK